MTQAELIGQDGADGAAELPELLDADLEVFDPKWNLQERHAAIMRALAKLGISVTGQNRFRRPALSIEDVDLILERLMGRFGVVSDYRMPKQDEVPTEWVIRTVENKSREDDVYEVWQMWVVSVVRDTRTADQREVEERLLFDVGSNPSACISFALKRHKRELYHLGAVKEGVSDEPTERARGRREDLSGTACPGCGAVGALGYSSRKQAYFCAQGKGGCGQEFASLEPASVEAADNMVPSNRGEALDVLMRLSQTLKGWYPAKVIAKLGGYSSIRSMSDADWKKKTLALKAELLTEHVTQHGAKCEHVEVSE